MAVNLASPGVLIREVDLTLGRTENVSVNVGVIAGPFEKGPVNEPVLIRNERELLATFGKPFTKDLQTEYWLSAASYLSYGGILRVIRSTGNSLRTPNVGVSSSFLTSLLIKNKDDYETNFYDQASTWHFATKTPGSWGNGIKIAVIDNFADQIITGIDTSRFVTTTTTTTFNVGVSTTGTVGVTTNIITGIVTTGISPAQVVNVLSGVISANTTVTAVGVGQVTLSQNTVNTGITTTTLEFGTTTTTTGTTSISPVGCAVTQSLAGRTVVSGGSVITYSGGYIRGLITGVGSSEIYVKITDTVNATGTSSEITYKESSSTAVNASSLRSVSSGITSSHITAMTAAGVAITTFTSATSVSDWYNQQFIDVNNTKVYWKNIAAKPGTSQYAAERASKNDEVHVVVLDINGSASGVVGTLLEKHTFLSKSTDGKTIPSEPVYFKNYLSEKSRYIYPGALLSSTTPSRLVPSSTNTSQFSTSSDDWGQETLNKSFQLVGNRSYTLLGGSDYSGVGGYSVELNDIISAYQVILDYPDLNVNYIISGPSAGSVNTSQAKANSLITIAETRKDCIAVISPHRSGVVGQTNSDIQTENIIDFFEGIQSSSYGVFDSGYKYTFDRFNNRFDYIPCNADIAGLMARTSLERYPWFSPAGSQRGALKNAVKLAYNPNQSQRDDLYTRRINPIISTKDSGIILFGDKTALGYASAFDRINVRQLFLVIEETIEKSARAQLFEFNDEITRTNFVNIVDPYLRDVKSKRGITDYLIVCDETNNTPEVIDNNEFKADIYIKPARSINFIGLTFVATRTGLSFSEVVGTV